MSDVDELTLAWIAVSLLMTWTGYLAGRDRGRIDATSGRKASDD